MTYEVNQTTFINPTIIPIIRPEIEEAFIQAYMEVLIAKDNEREAQHKLLILEAIYAKKKAKVDKIRNKLLGHDLSIKNNKERKMIFALIDEAKNRINRQRSTNPKSN